jgi:FkbH-like protein
VFSKEKKFFRIAIIGFRNTTIISKSIKKTFKEMSIPVEVYEAPYQQVETEVYNPSSYLYTFNPHIIVIIHSYSKEQNAFYRDKHRIHFSRSFLKKTKFLVNTLNNKLPSTIIIADNFEETNDIIFNNSANKIRSSFSNQIRRINVGLMDLAEENSDFHIFDKCALLSSQGIENINDNSLLINVDIPYKIEIETKLGNNIAQFISVFFGKIRKCLILDLDNTLWGGIIGDDGIEGIQLGVTGIGKAFQSLQIWANELKKQGILLAICSKNNKEIALNAISSHPEMILRKEDFSVIKINWENKVNNIQEIQQILNIGFDSMVFIDDSPSERELIRKMLPDVFVPEMPKDPANYLDYLRRLNLFEMGFNADNSFDRTAFFRQETARKKNESSFISVEDFLIQLNLKAKISAFSEANAARIAELSLRSNQFNLTTVRYRESDVKKFINDSDYLTYSLELDDKYGSYGIVSMVTMKLDIMKEAKVENWIISCRAIQRGIEDLLLNEIIKDSLFKGIEKLSGFYVPTDKNGIMKNFLLNRGFSKKEDDQWELQVANYKKKKTFIKLA